MLAADRSTLMHFSVATRPRRSSLFFPMSPKAKAKATTPEFAMQRVLHGRCWATGRQSKVAHAPARDDSYYQQLLARILNRSRPWRT